MGYYADNEVLDIVTVLLSKVDDATLGGLVATQADRCTEDIPAIILREAAKRLEARDGDG